MLTLMIFARLATSAAVAIPEGLGLSQSGAIQQASATCPEKTGWGEGISTRGCAVCAPWTGYSAASNVMPLQPPLYNASEPSLEITIEENVCRKVSFPCTLVAVFIQPPPRTIDIRHSYRLVDPVTNQKTPVGCTQKGPFPSGYVDFYYVSQGPFPYIVQTDDLGCKEVTCNKVTLYDLKRNRIVEAARVLEKDDQLCNADGVCPQLRVIPSPDGKTLAVVLWDNVLRKQVKVSIAKGSPVEWSTFTGRHTVHFVDTTNLLEGKVIKKTQRFD